MRKKTMIILIISALIIGTIFVYKKVTKQENINYESPLTASTKIDTTSLSTEQNKKDLEIQKDLAKNKYELSNAKIYLDPYGNSPLSAMIVFQTSEKVSTSVTLVGKENNDITLNYPEKTTSHFIPVYGLYPNYENTIKIKLSNKQSKEFTIKTNKIDEIEINTILSNTETNDIYLISSPFNKKTYGLDKHGEIRWVSPTDYYQNIIVLDNGHFLISKQNAQQNQILILEADLLGRIYKEYNINGETLNGICVKANGNIILSISNSDENSIDNIIVEITKDTGKIEKKINITNLIKQIDANYYDNPENNQLSNISNLSYDDETQSLIITYLTGNSVMNIDYSTSTIRWILSQNAFNENFNNKLLKINDDFNYPEGIRAATINKNQLTIFASGYNSASNSNTINKNTYSSVNTYNIENNQIILENEFDNNYQKQFVSGNINIIDTNQLIIFDREIDYSKYQKEAKLDEYLDKNSMIIEKTKNTVSVELKINTPITNVTKIDLNTNFYFDFEEDKYYSSTETYYNLKEITPDIIKQLKNLSQTVNYSLSYSNQIFKINTIFPNTYDVKIIFINKNNNGGIYTIKESNQKINDNQLINLSKGKYYIFINENGNYYRTNKYIVIE